MSASASVRSATGDACLPLIGSTRKRRTVKPVLKLLSFRAKSGNVKAQAATVWIRVPTKHLDDKSVFSRLVPSLAREIKSNGIFALLFKPVIAGKNVFAQTYMTREANAEKYCRALASRVFQAFEANFPKELRLRELSAQEIFDEMFASHRREHLGAPTLTKQKRIDVRRYLTSAEIECNETYYVGTTARWRAS